MAQEREFEEFEFGEHRGPIIDEWWDWDGYGVIFYCWRCRRLHIFTKTVGELHITPVGAFTDSWRAGLGDYGPEYAAYEKIVRKAREMGLPV